MYSFLSITTSYLQLLLYQIYTSSTEIYPHQLMSTISNQPDTHKNKTEKGRILTMLRYPSSCGIKDTTTTTSTISIILIS